MIGRVTLTVNYKDMSKRPSEFHCDNIQQAESKLQSINDWSSFVLVGVNYIGVLTRPVYDKGVGDANHVKDT
jgi:hypothetical protein